MSSADLSLIHPAERLSGEDDLLTALERRRSVEAPFLAEPGPSESMIRRMLTVASRVPDHGMLVPWRFVLIRGDTRARVSARVAEAYAAALPSGESASAPEHAAKIAKLGRLFTYAPLIVGVISTANPAARKPEWEQVLTVGAVCMNLTVAAKAMGFASVWLTGFPAYDPAARAVLGVKDTEKVAGLIHIGTATKVPDDRRRPDIDLITTELHLPPG